MSGIRTTTGGSRLQKTSGNNGILALVMQMNTIGLSIIYQEFRRAAWAYTMPHYHPKTASDSLAFIQGTGLDIVINVYGLMYDPDRLRNTFFSMVGDHAKIR